MVSMVWSNLNTVITSPTPLDDANSNVHSNLFSVIFSSHFWTSAKSTFSENIKMCPLQGFSIGFSSPPNWQFADWLKGNLQFKDMSTLSLPPNPHPPPPPDGMDSNLGLEFCKTNISRNVWSLHVLIGTARGVDGSQKKKPFCGEVLIFSRTTKWSKEL